MMFSRNRGNCAVVVGLCLLVMHSMMQAGEILLKLEEPTGLERKAWPVEIGLPFKSGELKDVVLLRVQSPAGENIPVQAKPLSRWPDGSVRWAHVLVFADMKAQKTENWKVLWNTSVPSARVTVPVRVTRGPNGIVVNTGPLQTTVAGTSKGIFENLVVDGKNLLTQGQVGTITIKDKDGKEYGCYEGSTDKTIIEEAGPLRAIIRMKGWHRSDENQPFLEYSLRLIFYSGKTWCEIEYAFTNDQDAEWTTVKEISVEVPLSLQESFQATTSEFKIDKFWEFDRPVRVYSGKDDLFGVFSGARIFLDDSVEIFGTGYESEARARFWLDASDGRTGLTASIQDMSNNYPKGIVADRDGVKTELYPSTEIAPLLFHQGWRKRHRMLLYFHKGSAREAKSQELAFCWQMPIIPWTSDFLESGAFGPIMPYQPHKYPRIERNLREAFIAYETGVGRGMIDYGDTRGTGTGERADFWANNAYDTPWAAFQMYARTGERRYWTRALSAAQHMMDIDIVHHSTRNSVEIGGVRIHGPKHVQYGSEALAGSSVAPNHEWVEGLLAAYHVTGNVDYLEAATGMADHILKALDAGWIQTRYNARWNGARNLGWPLLLLSVVHDETRNSRYIEGAKRIVQELQVLQMESGSFPLWIGPYQAAAPLHNAIAMEALGRYATITGDTLARQMYLRCADATFRDLTFPDGELIYIPHPDYRSGYRRMPWGGFHFGYVFTGDKKYLEFPLPLVMSQIKAANLGTYGEGALSYSLRGMLYYLNFADQAGLLQDLPPY